jgi:DNA polymerase I-like protein with 3'-5' exonuclease and polymerase domains
MSGTGPRKKAKPVMPSKSDLWPKKWQEFTWVAADDKKLALKVLDIVAANKSTALDTEFPTQGDRKDEAIIWSLSGAADQRFVLDGHWLRSKRSPFRDWIGDPNTKLVYFSFPADADVLEANMRGVDIEASFYADVKVEGWLRNNNKRRIALKEEEWDYLKISRPGYGQMFGYIPRGKSKWITIPPNVIMEGPLPEEMLETMSHAEWIELFKHYSGCDAYGTHALHRVNKAVLKRWGYWDTYLALDKPYTITLRHFQKRGIPIDFTELNRLDREITTDLLRHKTALRTLADNHTMSLDSQSKDLRKLIFETWGWPTYEDLQTDKGAPQLNKLAWNRYGEEEGFTFAKLMLPHNKLKTLKNTFINGIRNGTLYGPGSATNTLFSEYNQTGTKSGRMSSRKFKVRIPVWKHYKTRPSVLLEKEVKAGMNMLNFPNKFNDLFGVRRVVTAPPADDFAPEGYDLICGDYAGFELWMILYWCHVWGINSKMLRHMMRGDDVHSMTAVAVCNLDCKWEDVKEKYPEHRNNEGKRSNFGLGYGAGARVFARILGLDTRSEKVLRRVQRMIDAWNELWPEMPVYQRKCVSLGYQQGWVPTIAKRRIWVAEGLQSDDDGTVRHYENLCKNGPAQGSAADIVKDAQNIIERDPEMRRMGYRQFFNVYDEIVGAIPKRFSEEGVARQKWCMEQPFTKARNENVAKFADIVPFTSREQLPFGLRCEVHAAANWFAAK